MTRKPAPAWRARKRNSKVRESPRADAVQLILLPSGAGEETDDVSETSGDWARAAIAVASHMTEAMSAIPLLTVADRNIRRNGRHFHTGNVRFCGCEVSAYYLESAKIHKSQDWNVRRDVLA